MIEAQRSSVKGVHVYGSCVSRDTVPYLAREGIGLEGYTARQSLISAMSRHPIEEIDLSASTLKSNFQRRAIEGDFKSDFLGQIANLRGRNAYILWDLVDERNGTYRVDTGQYITNSPELNSSGIISQFSGKLQLLKFGSDEHYEIWIDSLRRAKDAMGDMWERTILLRSSWAVESVQGDVFPFGDSRLSPTLMNSAYTRYFDHATAQGVRTIAVPDELALTTRSHQWGMAPYHFHTTFYSFVAKAVSKIVGTG